MLLEHFLQLAKQWWRPVFAQGRTFERALAVLTGLLTSYGRHTVSKALCAEGRGQAEWAADYRTFSRAPWELGDLFTGVLATGLTYVPGNDFIAVFVDDTALKKSSRVIAAARWLRDALSPPFRVNLKYGLRCLHVALRLPLHIQGHAARAVSVHFELAPPAKKPGKRASVENVAEYERQKDLLSLPSKAVAAIATLRSKIDALGRQARRLLVVVDGGYTNRKVICKLPDRTDLLGRARKDIALCRPAPKGTRRVYGERLPTPEQIRQDPSIPYKSISCHYGGKKRTVRYKEVTKVLWPGGARRRLLRLFVIAPTPYVAPGPGRRIHYRDPAYLLTTDLKSTPDCLIQAYLDRWQIEPLHRDLKTGLGLGQAQVWSNKSVARLHSAVVATYAMITLAALQVFGPERTAAFPPLPAWRRTSPQARPSQSDIITMLRNDIAANGPLRPPPKPKPNSPQLPPSWALLPRETYGFT